MKFILTKEVGKLARWLRILGFDTVYFTSDNIGTLILEALREDRIIITRKKVKIDALAHKTVVITSNELKAQLKEVIFTLRLKIDEAAMFSRCTICNAVLEEIQKEDYKDKIPPYVYKTQKTFMRCPQCARIYWQGSHWGNVREVLGEIAEDR